MASVFVFGVAVVDFIHYVQQFPQGGFKHFSRDVEISGGGTGANAAVAVRRLGGKAQIGFRIGGDWIGELVVNGLRDEGVDIALLQRSERARSAFSSICIDDWGERQIVAFRGKNLSEDTRWLRQIPDCDAYLTDTSWEPGLEAVLAAARRRDKPGIVDCERSVLPKCLASATHLAFSCQGIMDLTKENSLPEALRAVAALYSSWICATDGENGTYCLIEGRLEHFPAFTVEARNTLAAGDVWHGAFALQLAEGAGEDYAVLFANAAAALKCARAEARAAIPSRSEVEAYLDGNG